MDHQQQPGRPAPRTRPLAGPARRVDLERRGPGAGAQRPGGADRARPDARRRTPPGGSATARSARSTPATCAARGRPPPPSPRCSGCRSSPTQDCGSGHSACSRGFPRRRSARPRPAWTAAGWSIRTRGRAAASPCATCTGEPPSSSTSSRPRSMTTPRGDVVVVAHGGTVRVLAAYLQRHPGRPDELGPGRERHRRRGSPTSARGCRATRALASISPDPQHMLNHSQGGTR